MRRTCLLPFKPYGLQTIVAVRWSPSWTLQLVCNHAWSYTVKAVLNYVWLVSKLKLGIKSFSLPPFCSFHPPPPSFPFSFLLFFPPSLPPSLPPFLSPSFSPSLPSTRNFKIAKGAVVCSEAQLVGDITIGMPAYCGHMSFCVTHCVVLWCPRYPDSDPPKCPDFGRGRTYCYWQQQSYSRAGHHCQQVAI